MTSENYDNVVKFSIGAVVTAALTGLGYFIYKCYFAKPSSGEPAHAEEATLLVVKDDLLLPSYNSVRDNHTNQQRGKGDTFAAPNFISVEDNTSSAASAVELEETIIHMSMRRVVTRDFAQQTSVRNTPIKPRADTNIFNSCTIVNSALSPTPPDVITREEFNQWKEEMAQLRHKSQLQDAAIHQLAALSSVNAFTSAEIIAQGQRDEEGELLLPEQQYGLLEHLSQINLTKFSEIANILDSQELARNLELTTAESLEDFRVNVVGGGEDGQQD